jgi:hypothetical protein
MATREQLNATLSRADELLRRKVEREEAELKREDAERMMAEREQTRADSHRCYQISERYDEAFRSLGVQTPAPIDGERPGQYRARLYEGLRRRLPPDHAWADVRADEVPADARSQIEGLVIAAARKEGERPSVANLPPDREISRIRIDPNTGARSTEYFSRESFIKGLGRPGRLVERILNPRTGMVLLGPPVSRVEVGGHYAPY